MTNATDEIQISVGGKVAVSLLTMIIRTPLDAWAIWLFWRWFATPLGAPQISFWHAFGLDLAFGLIFLMNALPPRREDLTMANKWAWGLLKVIVILPVIGVGALVHRAAGLG